MSTTRRSRTGASNRPRLLKLFQWAKKPNMTNETMLSYALSVEAIEKRGVEVPRHLYDQLKSFRKLRQDQRASACRTYLYWERDQPPKDWKAKKPNGSWRCSTHKSRYSFPCAYCMGHWT